MSGQGLPGEPGKHMWLTEAHTSQEAPSSVRGSSSHLPNIFAYVILLL